MSSLVQQSWQFAALVGLGFLSSAFLLRFAFDDNRDEWHLILGVIGAGIVLFSNNGLISDNPTRSFLILIGAGTMLLLLGSLVTYLLMTLSEVVDNPDLLDDV